MERNEKHEWKRKEEGIYTFSPSPLLPLTGRGEFRVSYEPGCVILVQQFRTQWQTRHEDSP